MTNSEQRQRVFIGGIGGGIGSSVMHDLLSAGATVGGFGRPSEQWASFRESQSEAADLYDAEATDSEAVSAAISAFVKKHDGLDAYVHAIGNVFLKPLHMIRDEEWDEVIRTNLNSAFYAARAALKPMRKQKSGVLVFFSSVAVQAGIANHEGIAAAKGGVEGLVRSIASTYCSMGIRANAVAPGLVRTGATSGLTGSEQALRISERMHPLGRIGEADEVASLVSWLISPRASWMTGQVIAHDGGMGTVVPKPRA